MVSSNPTPRKSTRLGGDALSGPHHLIAPAGSTSDHSVIRYPTIHDVSVEGDTSSFVKKGYTRGGTSSSSTRNEAQTGVRQPAKRPYLRRIGRRLPARTFPPPARPRKSNILPPSPVQVPAEYDVTSPKAPPSKPVSTLHNTGPPLAYQFQNRDVHWKDGEEAWSTVQANFEGEESVGDDNGGLDDDEENSDDDDDESDDEGYEDEKEGREASAPHIQPRPLPSCSPTTQTRPRAARSEVHQSYTLLHKTNGRPQVLAPQVLQGHQNASPLVRRSVPAQCIPPHPHNQPAPEALPPRPASFTTPRTRTQHIPEGPHRTTWPGTSPYSSPALNPTNRAITHYPSLGGYNGDVAGPSTEWDERLEAGGSMRQSLYTHSNPSVARSIYLEQQVARREEEAARREEEAKLKAEDARRLEMAARKAFGWVQSLEARAGRIHDAAMQAEAKAQRRDAETWERQAEILRQQAETAKREVEVTKREIAVERAEQEGRRKAREARRKEAELLLKEEDVRRKEQEALQMEEDARRMQLEMRWREEQLKLEKGRRAAEDRIGTKEIVVLAWEKLKGRISRDSQVDKQNAARILQDKDEINNNGIGVGSSSSTSANTDPESSTRAFVQIPRYVKVERRRTPSETSAMTGMAINAEDQELRSVSHMVTSECATSAEASAEYTVRSINSYKERLNRSPAGYFRHVPLR
ncbi:hypothetical protein EDB86DRAFT_481016 [Lactarius hatsudake]|nr:hypothetical protein EDB86DRAFT_481016 [Lactarius hatsudake]